MDMVYLDETNRHAMMPAGVEEEIAALLEGTGLRAITEMANGRSYYGLFTDGRILAIVERDRGIVDASFASTDAPTLFAPIDKVWDVIGWTDVVNMKERSGTGLEGLTMNIVSNWEKIRDLFLNHSAAIRGPWPPPPFARGRSTTRSSR